MTPHHLTRIKCLISGLIYLLSLSCNFQTDPDRIIGKYKVSHMNRGLVHLVQEFGENLSGAGEEVPPHVFEIGHTDEFIIAKQHPTNGFNGGYLEDTTVTNFYIIDMKNKFRKFLDMKIGPLTQKEFDSLRIAFKIQNIQFDKKYPDKL